MDLLRLYDLPTDKDALLERLDDFTSEDKHILDVGELLKKMRSDKKNMQKSITMVAIKEKGELHAFGGEYVRAIDESIFSNLFARFI